MKKFGIPAVIIPIGALALLASLGAVAHAQDAAPPAYSGDIGDDLKAHAPESAEIAGKYYAQQLLKLMAEKAKEKRCAMLKEMTTVYLDRPINTADPVHEMDDLHYAKPYARNVAKAMIVHHTGREFRDALDCVEAAINDPKVIRREDRHDHLFQLNAELNKQLIPILKDIAFWEGVQDWSARIAGFAGGAAIPELKVLWADTGGKTLDEFAAAETVRVEAVVGEEGKKLESALVRDADQINPTWGPRVKKLFDNVLDRVQHMVAGVGGQQIASWLLTFGKYEEAHFFPTGQSDELGPIVRKDILNTYEPDAPDPGKKGDNSKK